MSALVVHSRPPDESSSESLAALNVAAGSEYTVQSLMGLVMNPYRWNRLDT